MMRRSTITFTFLLALVRTQSSVVGANFFSRIIRFGGNDDIAESPQPSGASRATGSEAQVGSVIIFENGVLYAHLANNNRIPLVGLGVGNAPPQYVSELVAEAIQDDKKIRLIDTAHASNNEHIVSEGVLSGVQRLGKSTGKVEIHIVTKVWYTHLGYERTKISVEESFAALKPIFENDMVDAKLHILLHWPRCYDTVEWMDCENEERHLPESVKSAGPDPRKDPENAWKESWRLLEDLYLSDKYPIASIGVSNFHLNELETMEDFARIRPHILQVNIWSLMYDSHLVEYCHKHRIHVQVYNAIQGTVLRPDASPRAYNHIQKVAIEVGRAIDRTVTPAQVLLAWLIQHGVSVIPRTTRTSRLEENSAVSLASIPGLTDLQVETIAHAVEAYLSEDDLEQDIHVSVTFHAVSKDIMLYWRDANGDEVRIAHVPKGESFEETTYPNHLFRTYDASNKDIYIDHEIEANFGEHRHIHVEL